MFWEAVPDSCEVVHCTRLFKNAFKIKNTPDDQLKKTKARSRRLLGMASKERHFVAEPTSPSVDDQNSNVINGTPGSTPQKAVTMRKKRIPLEDCDPNSQDDGSYALSEEKTRGIGAFEFAEPCGVAPRRMSIEYNSPSRLLLSSPLRSSPLRQRNNAPRSSLFRSLSSGYESMEDGFNELIDMETLEEESQLPNGISNLLSGHIVTSEKSMECDSNSSTPEFSRIKSSNSLRRSLSFQNHKQVKTVTTPISKVRSCLFRSPNNTSSTGKLCFPENSREIVVHDKSPTISFKRPEPPTDSSPILVKRSRKCNSFQDRIYETTPTTKKTVIQRSLSETETHAHIKSAITRSTTDADLTADFSKPCILPLASGHHEDLKSISAETMAALIRGEFHDQVSTFKIVDCRYPYEYEGGHIEGALNLYTKDMIEERLLKPLQHVPEIQPDSDKRSILVFHCEFSWERGPNLFRFLRSLDRQRNKEHYPALHYPEVYLLHGGYEQFYKEQKNLCNPQGYRPMRHPDHEAELRQFRTKSKSWQGDKSRITGLTARTNLKRLGF